jgi:hypothetical protein
VDFNKLHAKILEMTPLRILKARPLGDKGLPAHLASQNSLKCGVFALPLLETWRKALIISTHQ